PTGLTTIRSLVHRPTDCLCEEEIALRRAINVDPADDAPRLVLADWLTEHGREEESNLIRAMVNDSGQKRRIKYMTTNPNSWPDVPRSHSCEVRRGFVEYVTIHLRDFLLAAPRLFAFHPITKVNNRDLNVEELFPKTFAVILGPAAESGGVIWPVEFFPGLRA